MSALSGLTPRLDRDAVRTFLVGDVVAILAFVVLGELRHGVDPVTMPGRFAGTAVPFLVGWAVVGALLGAYAASVRRGAGRLAAVTAVAWTGAAAVAQALRATAVFPGDADPVFYLVTVGFGGAILVAWRLGRVLLWPRVVGSAGADAR